MQKLLELSDWMRPFGNVAWIVDAKERGTFSMNDWQLFDYYRHIGVGHKIRSGYILGHIVSQLLDWSDKFDAFWTGPVFTDSYGT